MEQLDYNLLFRWFVGLGIDDPVWDVTVFTKNRDRLLEADVAKEFLSRVVEQAQTKGLTSDEHFTVDGTLVEAWAGVKSFQPKDQEPTARAVCALLSDFFLRFMFWGGGRDRNDNNDSGPLGAIALAMSAEK